ncbi:glycerophosphoryl diester phosphodiesterase [Mycolicibacterium neworleansense]|uniref:Glycerophosphoryl diester phosphodiesterase n=2 Tax=Mycolicibacterium neworleansense TaxID=146018 RepID=A0A0H5SC98_9MYCO|nr:glycerophosphoryl diester phosphodiesterase [Mycolicibacterium neworleansense]
MILLLALAAAFGSVPPAVAAPAGFDLQSHRGGRGETTEESLRAFAKSLELGVSTLELDIVLTKDKQPLVWHDPRIDETKCADTEPAFPGDPMYPYVGKLVHDLTLEQIRTLDCGKLLSGFPDAEVVRGNKIATLPEVFALTDAYRADVRFNIETKIEADKPETSATPEEFVGVILSAVRAAGKVGKVDIQSFDWRTLPLVRSAEPSIPRVALWDDTTWVPGSPWLGGVDPVVTHDPIVAAQSIGASALSPQYRLVNREFVQRAHALGLKVTPWTVNDPAAMRALIADGVDGLITDYPTRLRGVLADLGLPLPPAFQRLS